MGRGVKGREDKGRGRGDKVIGDGSGRDREEKRRGREWTEGKGREGERKEKGREEEREGER